MDSRLIKPKALLLKDYLLDDMSSCSSNGFKSFPRRQCCTTTVRFLIEIDHKSKQNNSNNNKPPKLSRSKSALSAVRSVIAAVKRLPFAAASSPGNKNQLKKKALFIPRSLSVKILRKSGFWKRKSSYKEIGRWKSFDQLLKEDPEPSDASISFSPTTTMTRSDGNSKSWSANEFTASDECTSGNSSSSEVNMDLPDQVRNDAVELQKNGDVSSDSTTNSECSNASSNTTNSSTKQNQWSANEDKEQLSPISVMDFPFDDDEEVSSPFQHGRMEGTQKNVMKKMKTFGSLEPMSLAKQFELHSPNSSNKSTEPIKDDEQDEEADDVEKQALNLLDQMDKTSLVPPNDLKTKTDRLLLDFFREKIIARNDDLFGDRELLEEAENWISERKPRELFLGWEVSKNREAYVKDMDKTKEWRLDDQESCKEVAVELGAEVFDALLNELLLDISS